MAEEPQPVSPLVLDEYFAAADDRFLPALRRFHEPKKLAAVADRWKKDHRPWARAQVLAYLDQPLNVAGHEPVVKRLFKSAEERGDDEMLAAFAVAFDRLVRRIRKTRHHYDWQTRQSWQEEHLASPRDVMPHVGKGSAGRVRYVDLRHAGVSARRQQLLFTYHTRYHLRRRAWRYFRRMGHRAPDQYVPAVGKLLARYADGFLGSGESLLDSWSLMHACFRASDVLDFGASKVNVKAGRSLAELEAAPDFHELWARPAAVGVLLALLVEAQSRAVRAWGIQVLRKHPEEHFAKLQPEALLPLLDHADGDVQTFAAETLERLPAMANLDVATWLRLLRTRNIAALEIIARLMERHVKPDRLTLEQMVDVANAQPVPVARLGLRFLQAQVIRTPADRATIARLAQARAEGVAGEITAWALSVLGTPEHYDVNTVTPFFDSLARGPRDAAWKWLSPESPGYRDPALWSRLIETPYDDVRFNVIGELQRRQNLPGASAEQVTAVWESVLLGIHRGGRAKLAALRQISFAIQSDPARAEPLLPVLAVAIRSVRLPEVRTGLSAVVAAVGSHPALAAAVARHLPELQLTGEEVPA